MYDYLIVGSGLYGAVLAHEAKAAGKSVLVIDKRDNILNEKMIRHYTHFAYKQTEIIHGPNNSCDIKI